MGRVRPEHRERFAAPILAGDLVRVHTVDREENPLYWRLLHAAGKATGLPVLYNTSFNLFGEPLVCTPARRRAQLLFFGHRRHVRGPLLACRSERRAGAAARVSVRYWGLKRMPNLRPLALLLLAGATVSAADAPSLTDQYRETAGKLMAAALADTSGYERLAYLCYRIGNRLSGSPALERAIAWSADQMKAIGLANVRVIPVKVPHWVRGAESARLVEPEDRPLHMLGLGMSIATPPGGITADVVSVNSFDELARLGADKIRGKIVLYNEAYQGYGLTSAYRFTGPSQAAALGAVAALVRSVTPLAMQIPHTGTLRYDPAQPQIPAAAVSPEDAMMMARFCATGVPVRVHLEMSRAHGAGCR